MSNYQPAPHYVVQFPQLPRVLRYGRSIQQNNLLTLTETTKILNVNQPILKYGLKEPKEVKANT